MVSAEGCRSWFLIWTGDFVYKSVIHLHRHPGMAGEATVSIVFLINGFYLGAAKQLFQPSQVFGQEIWAIIAKPSKRDLDLMLTQFVLQDTHQNALPNRRES